MGWEKNTHTHTQQTYGTNAKAQLQFVAAPKGKARSVATAVVRWLHKVWRAGVVVPQKNS